MNTTILVRRGTLLVLVLANILGIAAQTQAAGDGIDGTPNRMSKSVAMSRLSSGVGSCAVVRNANQYGGLRVRSGPSTSNSQVGLLSDGTVIKVLEGPRSGNGLQWWRHDRGGWSADDYLFTTACAVPVPAGPDVNAAQQSLINSGVMKAPWTQIDNAPIKNSSSQRNATNYTAVIEEFNPTKAEYAGRYKAGGSNNGDTRCNIFAADVLRAMGAPLPTNGNLGVGAAGSTNSDPMTATASQLSEWRAGRLTWKTDSQGQYPPDNGWRSINPTNTDGLRQLIAHVNAGKPAFALNSGHIAIIRPNQPTDVPRWQDLRIAQAGASNFLSDRLSVGFGSSPQPLFYVHD